jgi:hypothetical protein
MQTKPMVSYAQYLAAVAKHLGMREESLDVLAGEMIWKAWWDGIEVKECSGEVILLARQAFTNR